jgi:predicted transcriptional regulator
MEATTHNDTPTLGGSLRAARKALGLSQEALARRAQCSTVFVSLLERGYEPQESVVVPRVLRALKDAGRAENSAGSRIADDGGDHEKPTR